MKAMIFRNGFCASSLLDFKKTGLALLLGTAGGGVFAFFGAPLAWLLGAMVVTTIATLFFKAEPLIPPLWRTVMIAVLGVMLGSAFTPAIADRLGDWSIGAAIVLGYILLATLIGTLYFRCVAGYDPVTAYFSAPPGGLVEISLVGESLGADFRVLTLGHATRILVAVSTIPLWFRLFEGVTVPVLPSAGTTLADLGSQEAALLAVLGLIGVPLAKALKVPAAALVGPMILSALAHYFEIVHAAPPTELLVVAQVIVGTAIGCRFAGFEPSRARTVMGHAGLVAVIYVGLAALIGTYGAQLAGLPNAALVLAVAPGGLAEMTLIALAIGVETAFVSTMHIFRIAMVVFTIPPAFALMRKFT